MKKHLALALALALALPAAAQLPPYGAPILLNLDRANRSAAPNDGNTTNEPAFYVGDDLEIDVNLFSGGSLLQSNLIVNYTNVQFQIFAAQNDTNAPQIAATVTNVNFFTNLFTAGIAPYGTNNYPTNCQVQFKWPGALTSLNLSGNSSQQFWFRCFATGTNGTTNTFGEGPILVLNAPVTSLSPLLTFGSAPVVVVTGGSPSNVLSAPFTNFFAANSNILNQAVIANTFSGAALTNLVSTVNQNTTNFAMAISTNATNFAYLVALAVSNFSSTLSTNATNYASNSLAAAQYGSVVLSNLITAGLSVSNYVTFWGADASGQTVSWTAIQNCVNWVEANVENACVPVVVFPTGVYLSTNQISVTNGIGFLGEGPASSQLIFTNIGAGVTRAIYFHSQDQRLFYPFLERLKIEGKGDTPNFEGAEFDNCDFVQVSRCTVDNCDDGLVLNGVEDCNIENFEAGYNSDAGILLEAIDTTNSFALANVNLSHFILYADTNSGIHSTASISHSTFSSGHIEACGHSILFDNGAWPAAGGTNIEVNAIEFDGILDETTYWFPHDFIAFSANAGSNYFIAQGVSAANLASVNSGNSNAIVFHCAGNTNAASRIYGFNFYGFNTFSGWTNAVVWAESNNLQGVVYGYVASQTNALCSGAAVFGGLLMTNTSSNTLYSLASISVLAGSEFVGLGAGLTNLAGNGYVDQTVTNGLNGELGVVGANLTNYANSIIQNSFNGTPLTNYAGVLSTNATNYAQSQATAAASVAETFAASFAGTLSTNLTNFAGVLSTDATNYALSQGVAATASAESYAALLGVTLTNWAGVLSTNGSNYANGLIAGSFSGAALTNLIGVLSTNSTNFAGTLSTNSTNFAGLLSTNSTNFAGALSTNATNYAASQASAATTTAQGIGATASNVFQFGTGVLSNLSTFDVALGGGGMQFNGSIFSESSALFYGSGIDVFGPFAAGTGAFSIPGSGGVVTVKIPMTLTNASINSTNFGGSGLLSSNLLSLINTNGSRLALGDSSGGLPGTALTMTNGSLSVSLSDQTGLSIGNGATLFSVAANGSLSNGLNVARGGITNAAGAYYNPATASLSGTANIDWSTGATFADSESANSVLTMVNTADGSAVTVSVTDSGGHTITWTVPGGQTLKWSGGTAPAQTSGKTDVYTFIRVGTTIYGSAVQNF